MADKREVCNCRAYPFPHKRWGGQCTGDDDDEKCRHGYPVGEYCGYCEMDTYHCDLYHAQKDDGLLEGGYDFQNKSGKFVGYYDNPDG